MKRILVWLLMSLCLLPLMGLAEEASGNYTAALAAVEASPAEADISAWPLTGEELSALRAAYPDTVLHYSLSLYGMSFPGDAECIDLGETKVKDIGELLAALPYLNPVEIDMYESRLTREQMETLWSARPQIHWGWTLKLSSRSFRTDITAYSSLHRSSSDRYTSGHYEVLKYCWQLKALDLGHNKLTDLSFIGTMKELRVLILADNYIRDITPLAELKKLQYVELFKNRIKDLSPLAGMPELLDLNLCHGSFVDLSAVYTMPKLERLWVSRHKEQPEGYFEEIAEKLPNVELYEDRVGCTGGTWRKHPRYEVIHQMFKGFEYIPFAEEDGGI